MRKLTLSLLALMMTFSCNEGPTLSYKYGSNPDMFECDYEKMDLIKEALYAFEDYIFQHHNFKGPETLERGYANYWSIAMSDRLPFIDKFDDHLKAVAREVLAQEDLWVMTNGKMTLNLYDDLGNCIIENFQNEDLKETMEALVETKTFRSDIFVPTVRRKTMQLLKDKAMATYVALDLFYGKLHGMDLDNTENNPVPEPKDHSGHNHD